MDAAAIDHGGIGGMIHLHPNLRVKRAAFPAAAILDYQHSY
jgi:hypothetical protein